MLKNFRTYNLATEFHFQCENISKSLPGYLRSQLLRASSSVALNLAEGSGKSTMRDKFNFYNIALGSLRECQSALELAGTHTEDTAELQQQADVLGAHLYKLVIATKAMRYRKRSHSKKHVQAGYL